MPSDICGRPQRLALDALDALPFREVKATPLGQDVSQESLDTGCGQMCVTPWQAASSSTPRPRPPGAYAEEARRGQVCLWWTRTTGYPELLSRDTVTGRELAALLPRLDELGAARPCRSTGGTFAVLQYVRAAGTTVPRTRRSAEPRLTRSQRSFTAVR